MHITSADGVECCLLFDGNTHYIRVYDKVDKNIFKDYDIVHSDLNFIIKDADAFFYESGDNLTLDHSPTTLGGNYRDGRTL